MASSHPKLPGKYKILAKIHQGGMGDIYRVRHKLLEVERVIKMIRPQLASEAKFRRRFLEEARGATQLDHPNIAKLFDFSISEDGTTWMVLEYIPGVSLKEILQATGPPELSLTLEIARQCLRALGFLHRKGWVHRDISPDNIMLAEDVDHKPLIKLIDLGIAKKVTGGVDLTSAEHFFAKMRYSSPEHFSESGAEPRSDLYSLGLVLYELLTGQQAITGADPHKLMRAQLEDPPLSFALSDPQGRVPEDLRQVVLRVLAKRPEERFATAEDFTSAIAEMLAAHPLPALDMPRLVNDVLALQPRRSFSTGKTQDHLDRQFGSENTPTRPSSEASDSWRQQPGSGSRSLRMPSPEEMYQQTTSGRLSSGKPSESPDQAAAGDLEDLAGRTLQLPTGELQRIVDMTAPPDASDDASIDLPRTAPPAPARVAPGGADDVRGALPLPTAPLETGAEGGGIEPPSHTVVLTDISSLIPPPPVEDPGTEPSSPALRYTPPMPPPGNDPTESGAPGSEAPSLHRNEEPTAPAPPADSAPAIKLEMPPAPGGVEAPQRTRVADSSNRDLVREARQYAESQGWTLPPTPSSDAAPEPPPPPAASPPPAAPRPPAEPRPSPTTPSPRVDPPAGEEVGTKSPSTPPPAVSAPKTPEAPIAAPVPSARPKTPSRYVRLDPAGPPWWVDLCRRFPQLEPLPGRLRATGKAIGSRFDTLVGKARKSPPNLTDSPQKVGEGSDVLTRLAPYRLPILGGVAALVVAIVLLLAWPSGSEPESETTESAPPPPQIEASSPVEIPPPPVAPPPPMIEEPTELHPMLQEAQRYLAEGDMDLAAEALATIEEDAIALFDNERQVFEDIRRQLEENAAAIGEQQADQIAQMLAALENGSIPQLRASYDALYEPRLASPEAFLDHWDDFKRADRILKAHTQLLKSKKGLDLLKIAASAQHLVTLLPAYENRDREMNAAIDPVMTQARHLQADGNLGEAKALLEALRSTLSEPPAELGPWVADLEQQLKADDNIRSNLRRAAAYGVEGQPDKGLELLAQLDLAADHALSSELEQLRQSLSEDLRARDRQSPEIRLDGAELPTYRRNQSVELSFVVTDDYRVVGVEAWVRVPGDGWQAADLEETSGGRYKLTITRDHHQNKRKLELYLKATDVSGNDGGTFGTRGAPKTLNRKGRIF